MRRVLTAVRVVFLLVIVGAVAGLYGVLAPAREKRRSAMCQWNIESIQVAFAMYAHDNDGHLPLDVPLQDMVGEGWDYKPRFGVPGGEATVQQPGPLYVYSGSAGLFFCDSDPYRWRRNRFPEPGISYRWNRALAGHERDKLPPDTPLCHDREPWHLNDSRNVALEGVKGDHPVTPGNLSEEDFQRAMAPWATKLGEQAGGGAEQ